MQKIGTVYIVTNKNKTVLYIGVTSNLKVRIWQHKNKFYKNSFTARYNCDMLVFYQTFPTILEAIHEEKRLKAGNRKRKIDLINQLNPDWKDLYDELD